MLKWLHATFVVLPMSVALDTVLGQYEEVCKSVVREVLRGAARFINGAAAWLVTTFVDPEFRSRLRAAPRRQTAWQRWFARRHPSTFNALVEREGDAALASPSLASPGEACAGVVGEGGARAGQRGEPLAGAL